jgi:hypothetical protein
MTATPYDFNYDPGSQKKTTILALRGPAFVAWYWQIFLSAIIRGSSLDVCFIT